MFIRRGLTSCVLAATLLVGSAGIALGHECVISNRSDQGNASAQHSGVWGSLGLADVFGFIHEVVAGPPLTASQIEWAVDAAVAAGLPADGWVIRTDKTIGAGSSNPNLVNGKGLDHLAGLVGEQIVGIYFQALDQ